MCSARAWSRSTERFFFFFFGICRRTSTGAVQLIRVTLDGEDVVHDLSQHSTNRHDVLLLQDLDLAAFVEDVLRQRE